MQVTCKSIKTTKDHFIKKGLIDNYYNILNLSKFREDNIKWTNFAKSTYNVDEGLIYLEENNGKKAVPNTKVFNKIDEVKRGENKKVTQGELFNSISLGVSKFLGLNIDDYESIKPTKKLTGEFINNLSSTGFKILWDTTDIEKSSIPNWLRKTGIGDIANWRNNQSIGKLLQRDYSELSSMEENSIFNSNDRILYNSLRLIQSLTSNPLNSRLAKKLGVDSITFVNNPDKSSVYVNTNSPNTIYINIANLDDIATETIDYDNFIDASVFEELIHKVALKVAPIGSQLYKDVIKEVQNSPIGFSIAVEDIYKQVFLNDFTKLHEGVRMLMQEEFLGFITEETLKNNRASYGDLVSLKKLFKKMWNYIADFFEQNTNSKELANQIRTYINSNEFNKKFELKVIDNNEDFILNLYEKASNLSEEEIEERIKKCK